LGFVYYAKTLPNAAGDHYVVVYRVSSVVILARANWGSIWVRRPEGGQLEGHRGHVGDEVVEHLVGVFSYVGVGVTTFASRTFQCGDNFASVSGFVVAQQKGPGTLPPQ
jgi:hypothetical protein